MVFVWDSKLETGFKLIDEHHKRVFAYLNRVMEARENKESVASISTILAEFIDFFSYHCRLEEDMCEIYGYGHIDEIKSDHDFFIKKVTEYRDDLESGDVCVVLKSIIKLFQKEVVEHLNTWDKRYVSYVLGKITEVGPKAN